MTIQEAYISIADTECRGIQRLDGELLPVLSSSEGVSATVTVTRERITEVSCIHLGNDGTCKASASPAACVHRPTPIKGIDEVSMTVELYNTLKRAEISDVARLSAHSAAQLVALGIPLRGVQQARDILAGFGIPLEGADKVLTDDALQADAIEKLGLFPGTVKRLRQLGITTISTLSETCVGDLSPQGATTQKMLQEIREKLAERKLSLLGELDSVQGLELSIRAKAQLDRAKISTIAELVMHTQTGLRYKGIHAKVIRELVEALWRRGLALNGMLPDHLATRTVTPGIVEALPLSAESRIESIDTLSAQEHAILRNLRIITIADLTGVSVEHLIETDLRGEGMKRIRKVLAANGFELKDMHTGTVDDLPFSNRTYNCFKRAGIDSLRELSLKSELELLRIRHLGRKSLNECIQLLAQRGIELRDQ